MTTSTSNTSQPRIDVYARVTAKIIADLERGVRIWQRPWNADHTASNIIRPRRANGLPYRGVNVLLLWSEALDKGYTAPMWMTYKHATTLGAQVRTPWSARERASDDDRHRNPPYHEGWCEPVSGAGLLCFGSQKAARCLAQTDQ